MIIFGTRVYSGSNDFIYKLWAVAAVVILIVAAVLTWNDRFRESLDTSIARVSVFGVENAGSEVANYTGSRGFFAKMNKLGLPPSARKAELAALFTELKAAGTLSENVSAVPVIWLFAEGLTKDERDRSVQTYGKVFFDKKRFCISVVDGNGFAVQLDSDTFRVLWARDGGAICAVPLLQLPDDVAERGFALRIEERGNAGQWTDCGEFLLPKFSAGAQFAYEEGSVVPVDENDFLEPEPDEIFPQNVAAESISVPQRCRFFSSELWNREKFGELRLKLTPNASGRVPAAAWSIENFGLSAMNLDAEGDFSQQNFPDTRADAFHKAVRFLEGELFETDDGNGGGALRVPVAKTLFPTLGDDGNPLPWRVDLTFVRSAYFTEDFHEFPSIRIGTNASVLANPISAKNSTVKVRAFRDADYFRRLKNKPSAVVLEIENPLEGANADFYWEPTRVKANTGEELFTESRVNVSPSVRQYFFLPQRGEPARLDVVFAVTRRFRTSVEVAPEIVVPETIPATVPAENNGNAPATHANDSAADDSANEIVPAEKSVPDAVPAR